MSQALLKVDMSQIVKLAENFKKSALNSKQRFQLLQDLGSEVEDQTIERFDTKISPQGRAWDAISARHQAYLSRKFPGATPALVMTGGLRDSIETRPSDEHVWVGSTKVYSAAHQWGWPARNVPDRPFLGINRDNTDELARIANAFLERSLKATS